MYMQKFIACLALSMTLARAQSPLATGHVLDPQGKPVENALVHLCLAGRDVSQVKSGPAGEFRFEGLGQGPYRLRAEAPGFAPVEAPARADVELQFRDLAAQTGSVV